MNSVLSKKWQACHPHFDRLANHREVYTKGKEDFKNVPSCNVLWLMETVGSNLITNRFYQGHFMVFPGLLCYLCWIAFRKYWQASKDRRGSTITSKYKQISDLAAPFRQAMNTNDNRWQSTQHNAMSCIEVYWSVTVSKNDMVAGSATHRVQQNKCTSSRIDRVVTGRSLPHSSPSPESFQGPQAEKFYALNCKHFDCAAVQWWLFS